MGKSVTIWGLTILRFTMYDFEIDDVRFGIYDFEIYDVRFGIYDFTDWRQPLNRQSSIVNRKLSIVNQSFSPSVPPIIRSFGHASIVTAIHTFLGRNGISNELLRDQVIIAVPDQISL